MKDIPRVQQKNDLFLYALPSLLGAVCFAALHILTFGYFFAEENHFNFMPVIINHLQDVYVEGDFNILVNSHYHINFMGLCTLFSHLFGIERAFFLLYGLTLTAFYFAITLLSHSIFPGRKYNLWLTFLFLLTWGSLGLESNTFWQNYIFEAHFFAWPLALVGIAAYFQRFFLISGLLFGASSFFHFHIGADNFAVTFLALIFFYRFRFFKHGFRLFLGFLPFFLIFVVQHFEILTNKDLFIPGFDIAFNAFRMPHHFEIETSRLILIIAFFFLTLCFYAYKRPQEALEKRSKNPSGMLLALIGAHLAAYALHLFDFYYLKFGFLAKLQFVRISPAIFLLFYLCIATSAMKMISGESPLSKLLGLSLIFVIFPFLMDSNFSFTQIIYAGMFIASFVLMIILKNRIRSVSIALITFLALYLITSGVMHTPYAKYRIYERAKKNSVSAEWRDLTLWIQKNTSPGKQFITPPYERGFSTLSKRSTVAEYKVNPLIEGQVIEWLDRLESISGTQDLLHACSGWGECRKVLREGFESQTPEDIIELSEQYNAHYLVSEKEYPFQEAYRNTRFKVYSL